MVNKGSYKTLSQKNPAIYTKDFFETQPHIVKMFTRNFGII